MSFQCLLSFRWNVCNVLFEMLSHISRCAKCYGYVRSFFFLSFLFYTLLIISTCRNLHKGKSSFKIPCPFCICYNIALFIIFKYFLHFAYCSLRIDFPFLLRYQSIVMAQNARFGGDCVGFIVVKVCSTFTLTMIRWYMSNDQRKKRITTMERRKYIYNFIDFRLDCVVCCIYYAYFSEFLNLIWIHCKRARQRENDSAQQCRVFVYGFVDFTIYSGPLLYREFGIFAAISIQLLYENEGRIIFSDILRVCFRSIISTAACESSFHCSHWFRSLAFTIFVFRIDFYAFAWFRMSFTRNFIQLEIFWRWTENKFFIVFNVFSFNALLISISFETSM